MAVFKQFGRKAHEFITRHPSQDKKYNLLEGSVRSSKTYAVDAKLIVHLCLYKVEGKRVICGNTKQQVYKNVLLDLFAVIGSKNYKYNQQNGELWLFGTQWFVIGAKDEGSYKQILGMTIGLAICDEWSEFPRSFTMQLFLRMSPAGARLYATTNPATPQHYLYTEVIHGKDYQRDLEVIHFTLADNPNIGTNEKRQIIASQTGVYYLRYILGLWVVAEGAIYKDAWSLSLLYDETNRPIGLYGPGGWIQHVITVDYGTTNPCVFLEALDDGHRAWIDREYYWDSVREMRQKTDSQYADDLEAFIAGTRLTGVAPRPKIIIDPSAASFKIECQKRGLWIVDADNDVDNGIRRMANLMAAGRVRVHRDCKDFQREVPIYEWDKDKAERGEEAPIKANDHAMDAGRYLLADLFPDWRLAIAA